jgi:spore germination protein GerM
MGRLIAYVALFAVALGAGWWFFNRQSPPAGDHVTVYYTKLDGSTEVPWNVSLGPARDPSSVAFYAATQVIAGPPAGTDAVRFPNGTRVRAVRINASTAAVDISKEVAGLVGGSFAEAAAFKSLVWTMTGLPGISSVTVLVDGARVPTLPGGHFELDEPLTRSSW